MVDDDAAGVASPADERWGDEWFDDEARRSAAEEEKKIVEQARPTQAAPQPKAAQAPGAPITGIDLAPGVTPKAPEPEPTPLATDALARPIAPPHYRFADLARIFGERRTADQTSDAATFTARSAELENALADLDVPEVDAYAMAAAREALRLMRTPRQAVERAELGVRLGPNLPTTHVVLARARFAADIADVTGWAPEVLAAGKAAFSDPRYSRPLLFDAASALVAGLLAAGALLLLLFLGRHARTFFHDFHHLFPRRTSPLQSGALAVLLLALPFLFWSGPLLAAGVIALAIWLYLNLAERIAASAFLILLGAVAPLASLVATRTAWDGTPAELIHAIERSGDVGRLPELKAWASKDDAPSQAAFALARAEKREGDLDGARALYERVLRGRASWPAALVNLGNVRFLQGDMAAAERLYKDAINADPSTAEAYFDLSRLYYRRLDLSAGQDTRTKALDLDRSLVARYAAGEEPTPRANRLLVDVPLSNKEIAVLATMEGEPSLLLAQSAALLVGRVPLDLAPLLPLVVLALLLGFQALQRKLMPSPPCSKCGRPQCVRCDPDARGGDMCGQCMNVFARKAAVDPLARVQKEIAVRRFQTRRTVIIRVASFLLSAQVLSGRTWRGALLLTTAAVLAAWALEGEGLIHPAYGGLPMAWKLGLMIPPLVVVYLLAVRDGLRTEED